jgi:ribokinase
VSGAPIVVVGEVMTDVLVRVTEPLALASDTRARVHFRGGGAAANVAVWLAHLGQPPVLISRVGDDPVGEGLRAEVAGRGVDARLAATPGFSTGACVVLVDSAGERTMLPDPGAGALLTADDLPGEALRPDGHLHVSGYSLLDTRSRPAALDALARARSAGMTTSVDPASASLLEQGGATEFLGLTEGVDVLLSAVAEARVLVGPGSPDWLARRLCEHYPEVVVSLGAGGALWRRGAETVSAPAARPPGEVVDLVGAGDALTAGWLAARADGAELERCLRAACHAGALAVTREGAWPERRAPGPTAA